MNCILDRGEDLNANSVLDPGNIAEVPTVIITDATGFGEFDIKYAREYTWVEVELEARVTVAGSEDIDTARFFLPGLASDFNNCEISPPGRISPYGQATTCSCDERVGNAPCPTRTSLPPIRLTPSFTVGSVGETIAFSVSGGSETVYYISATNGGVISPSTEIPFGPGGANFSLFINSTPISGSITVTASDRDTILATQSTVVLR